MKIHCDPFIEKKQAIAYIDDRSRPSVIIPLSYEELFSRPHLTRRSSSWRNWNLLVKTFLLTEHNLLQKEQKIWRTRNHPQVNEMRLKFWDVLDFLAATSKTFVWTVNLSRLGSRNDQLSIGPMNLKNFISRSKDRISEVIILAVPSKDYLLHIDVDSSNVGTVAFFQQFNEKKVFMSFIARVFDKAEQKKCTLHRDFSGMVSALLTYEHYIIGSLFPIYLYCNHKPILYLWGRNGHCLIAPLTSSYQHKVSKSEDCLENWM